jgi:hypothetical protein
MERGGEMTDQERRMAERRRLDQLFRPALADRRAINIVQLLQDQCVNYIVGNLQYFCSTEDHFSCLRKHFIVLYSSHLQ